MRGREEDEGGELGIGVMRRGLGEKMVVVSSVQGT